MKTQYIAVIFSLFLFVEPSIACTCAIDTQDGINKAILNVLRATPNVIIGKVIRYTYNTTASRQEVISGVIVRPICAEAQIEFEVEKSIRGGIREKTILKFNVSLDLCTFAGIVVSTCIFPLKFGVIQNGRYEADTVSKYILFVGSAPQFEIRYEQCLHTTGAWTTRREEYLDSLNKVANTTSVIMDNKSNFILFPSPANRTVQISFEIPKSESVTLELLNVYGGIIEAIIDNTTLNSGSHNYSINVSGLANGVYFCRIRKSSGVQVQRVIVQK